MMALVGGCDDLSQSVRYLSNYRDVSVWLEVYYCDYRARGELVGRIRYVQLRYSIHINEGTTAGPPHNVQMHTRAGTRVGRCFCPTGPPLLLWRQCFVCAFQRPTLTRGYDCVAVVLAQRVVVVVREKKILAGRLQKREFFHAQAQGDEPGDRRKAVMRPASDSMPKMIGHIPLFLVDVLPVQTAAKVSKVL